MRDMYKVWPVLLCLLLLGQGAMPAVAQQAVQAADTETTIGDRIYNTYATQLQTLSLNERKHFALRMYRLSGDDSYLTPISRDAERDAKSLHTAMQHIADPKYRRQQAAQIVENYRTDTKKYRLRKKLLARSGEIAFAKSLLYDVYQADDYGLIGQKPLENIEPALTYLRGIDWAGFWLAPATLDIYTAQSVNQIYYLYHLGLADLRAELNQALRQRFPDQRDAALNELEFNNKIYGLTHIIIAASDYYQRFVERLDHAWIYAYFEDNIDRIIATTKPDIYAEVALCFLLANEREHAVVSKVKQALETAFDAQAQMIPSIETGTDLEQGEHRNTLAIMIYRWPEKLHPGPILQLP
jgi:hypothetical protein